ncbi:hypothetical protein [Streptomyces sp. NPDC056600]|uniref:hypothetical protein n=1 Tax=Streptomyces sp. NPDC056600 TaxID=3345874 RepID=UPI00368C87FE
MHPPAWKNHRVLVAVWAVLCGASLVVTLALEASPAPVPAPASREPGGPVSADCAAYVADVERTLAEARQEGRAVDVQNFTRAESGAEDCDAAVRDHMAGRR